MTNSKRKTVAPYGSWSSPITADLIVKQAVRLGEVRLDRGDIYWLEGRPDDKGRGVIVKLPEGAGTATDITPPRVDGAPTYDVGSQVYQYGGGAWIADEGAVYFSDMSTGRLFRQDGPGAVPVPLTPDERAGHRPARFYADGLIDRGRKRWIGVVEDWTAVDQKSDDFGSKYPRHRIAAVDLGAGHLDSSSALAEDHDFFSTPRLSPDGGMLAWLAWDHPQMPWQGSVLYMAELDAAGLPAHPPIDLAGGPAESVLQPEWSPDGAELWFVSDRSGWWNLYRYRLSTREFEAVTKLEAEFGKPQWNLGMSSYAFAGDGRVVAAYSRAGEDRLAIVEPGAGEPKDFDLPFTVVGSVRAAAGRAVFVGAGPSQPASVVSVAVATGEYRILKQAAALANDSAISQHFSRAEPMTFPTTGGEIAHALFYPPTNADFTGPAEERPPVVVMCHGGPTARSTSALDFDIQYWTSRGVAALDVNYRGSSGYGRIYRDRLKESWGVVDVEDCISAAQYLAGKGLVDGGRAVITGGSAGGFTTLAALTFHDYFRAGASSYGIGDLERLAKDTHKFESHYLDWLVGPYPATIERYRQRSPIHHIDKLSRPVIFFQGELDQVVPPNQSEAMFDAIKSKGLSAGYFLFAGERHGFKQDVNIRRAIEAEHYFFTFEVFRSKLSFPETRPSASA